MGSPIAFPVASPVGSPLRHPLFGGWTPAKLFSGGAAGAWYEPSPATCYQDTGQTTPAGYTDTVAACVASYGAGPPLLQATAASEPQLTATPDRLVFDLVDDMMGIDFTGSGGFTATLIQASKEGTFSATVNVPDGVWSVAWSAAKFTSDNISGLALVEGSLSATDIARARNAFISNGAGDDFSGVSSASKWFYGRNDLVALDVSNWDTSSVTTFFQFAYSCTNLTTLDVSNWDTSSVTTFSQFVNNCSSLTTLDVSNWDTSSVTTFQGFAYNCSSLTTVTVSGGTGSPFSDSPCTNYTGAFANTNLSQQSIDDILVAIAAAGTSNGTFDQSGGSVPSANGTAAIDTLRGRGWTVTVTGGY